MREFARINRIINLLKNLWEIENNLDLGYLLEKWVWSEYVRDIFFVEDTKTESILNGALKSLEGKPQKQLNETQLAILSQITEKWPLLPDQRLGQFLSNYAFGHFLSHPENKMLQQEDNVILSNLKNCN